MANRITLQPAFILHTRPFRDTSLLIDLLTWHHGRIHAIARSARGLRSRFKGLLQPFTPFLISWSGTTELMSLSRVESNGAPYLLSGNALISGFYLNELLTRLLHRHDAHPNLYAAYQNALDHLQRNEHMERTLRLFELHLLSELGYGLQLNKEILNEEQIIATNFYRFDVEHGFIACNHSDQKNVFRGETLLALHHQQWDEPEILRDAKRLLRLALMPLLGSKPLRSRELFVR